MVDGGKVKVRALTVAIEVCVRVTARVCVAVAQGFVLGLVRRFVPRHKALKLKLFQAERSKTRACVENFSRITLAPIFSLKTRPQNPNCLLQSLRTRASFQFRLNNFWRGGSRRPAERPRCSRIQRRDLP